MPNIRPLSEKLQAKAIAELNEVPSRLDADIAALREWIEKQPHLITPRDDQFLVTFLRGCKFSLEKAKKKIDMLYTFKTKYDDLFNVRNVDSPRVQEILGLGVGVILPKPMGEDGPRIAIFRPGAYSPDKFNMVECMMATSIMSTILMREDDNFIISGCIGIMDFSNVTAAHILQINPSFMRKSSFLTEEALPVRHIGSYFINLPNGFETVFNYIKQFISEKMQERMFVFGRNLEELYKVIPQKYLPAEYGGENGSISESCAYWQKKSLVNLSLFKDDEKYGVNEALRLGPSFDFDNVFGMEGSFRKLDFD